MPAWSCSSNCRDSKAIGEAGVAARLKVVKATQVATGIPSAVGIGTTFAPPDGEGFPFVVHWA